MAKVAVTITDETREKLIELAGGERKIGEKLNELVAEEWTRQTVSLEALAERVGALNEELQILAFRLDHPGKVIRGDDTFVPVVEEQQCPLCGSKSLTYCENDQGATLAAHCGECGATFT